MIINIGDLSQSLQTRRDTGTTKSELVRLTGELSSGVSGDLVSRLNGDFGPLASIERGLSRVESFQSTNAEFELFVSTQQATIGYLRELGSISNVFLAIPETGDNTLIVNAGTDALSRFDAAIDNLNIQIAGRSVFSGVETNRPALASAETILLALETEIATAGAATAADVSAVVETWFAVGGGYDTVGYTGGPAPTTAVQLSDTEAVTAEVTAENDAIRDQLRFLSLGALLGRNLLSGDIVEQGALARMAGEGLNASDDRLIAVQSSLGSVEASVERARVEVGIEADNLRTTKAELVEVDPFNVAVELQNAETRLQSIYAITARLSRLSLVEYLR